MFFERRIYRHPEFRQGILATAPVTPGTSAWGLMMGVAMVKSGMSALEAGLMTVLVYAGSSQLAAIPLIVASAPAWVILATAFCVNLRFVVFSLHMRPYLMHMPRWRRLVNGFLTADLTYAIFTSRFTQPAQDAEGRLAQEAFLAGNYFLTWVTWVGASLAGVFLGNLVPTGWGLGFAGILCLLAILCSLTTTPLRVLAALIAGAVAIAAYSLPLKLNVVLAIGAAVLLCFRLEAGWPRPKEAP
ncbi:MAG TPA: AzlC family ABC transporter permease [Ramlibacter sp.]|uniref:AzlC family ABC transporter permease n=1 Tax=Ramlibacter sp. TaxID=1917967 RepID=UPI002C71D63A|nr:AzlC family ABC transporter permease [Ramlibacter sp.]HVZ47113.1 AzlC family ABC transporter permease [Ramlibacter sp.]